MSPLDLLAVELSALEFVRPGWLLALLPLVLLLGFLRRARRGADAGWRAVIDSRLLPHLLAAGRARNPSAGLALLAFGGVVAVIALAGPARPGATDLAWRSDAARVLVVDLSPAMAALDLLPARAERARLKVLDLLRAAPGGQTALVAYADEPYLVAPLTSDAATIALLVPELDPEVMPQAGDRPERALRMAGEILKGSGAPARDLVWITATADSAATSQALKALPVEGLRLSVLHLPSGPGADSESPLAALRQAAEASGGRFLSVRADDGDVRALAALLASAQETVAEDRRATLRARELGPWLVLLLVPLAALAFRRGVLLTLALPLLLTPPSAEAFGDGALWVRADQRGHRLLAVGDPSAAAQAFADPRWRAVAYYRAGRYAEAAGELAPFSDADSHYNRGNALARLDRLEEALDAYRAALRLRPGDPDIRHNHDLVRELLARREPEPPQQADDGADDAPQELPAPADRSRAAGQGAGVPPSDELSARQAGGMEQSAAHNGASLRGRSGPAREAALLAEQWLRRVPDEPGGLLRRKLMLEHARRQAGQTQRPW